MPEALNISAFPKIGPTGLSLDQFPEMIRTINITDVYEAIRWVHADLRQIHIAFKSVYELQREMAGIRGLATLQKAQFKAQASIVQDLGRRISGISVLTNDTLSIQSQAIDELSRRLVDLEVALKRDLQEFTSRITEYVEQTQISQQLRYDNINQKFNTLMDRHENLEAWLRRPWWKKFWESLRGSRAVR